MGLSWLATLMSAFVIGSSLAAQSGRTDPYTRGDAEAMKRLGYVSFGPFAWGDGHDTAAIRRMLPTVRLHFVETAHFKIGSALPVCAVPKAAKRKRALRRELAELKRLLPAVRPRRRQVDPWLRLHLMARRLEKHYAEFQEVLGVKDADFPQIPLPVGEPGPQGQGPYLGMRGKFLILMCQKSSSLGRYAASATGKQQAKGQPYAHYFHQSGSIFYGTHTEILDGDLADDHKMHCHVVFCASQALIMGYRGFHYHLPAWLVQGLGHWFSHRLDPLEHTYRSAKGKRSGASYDPRWNRNVYGLVKNEAYRSFAELARVQHSYQLEVLDVMTAWSYVDFMLERHAQDFRRFFEAAKAPIRGTEAGPPPFKRVLAQQDAAFRSIWKKPPEELEKAWGEYVRKAYRKR